MGNILQKMSKYVAEKVYNNIEKGSGHMILVTSMTGIFLSCIAQTFAILLNKKYSVSQKAFMIPQEITEGMISIASMFAISRPSQILAKKCVKSGKILTKEMSNYLKKHNLYDKKGHLNFDFEKNVKDIIFNIEKSNKFIKSSDVKKEKLVSEHYNILKGYDELDDATSAIATTTGSIISTAIISPLIRNYTASHYQKINLAYYNSLQNNNRYNTPILNRPAQVTKDYSRFGLSKI